MSKTKCPKRDNKYNTECWKDSPGKLLVKSYLVLIFLHLGIILPQGLPLNFFIDGPVENQNGLIVRGEISYLS